MPEITKATVFAKISKSRSDYVDPRRPWVVTTKNYRQVNAYGRHNGFIPGDFATKGEATEAAENAGMVIVEKWDEAKELTLPLRNADYEASQRRTNAIAGLVSIVHPGKGVRYLTPADMDEIFDQLGEPDEFGRVGDAKGKDLYITVEN